jgi:hypothetical protein
MLACPVATLQRAVDIFIHEAYGDAPVPKPIQAKVDRIRNGEAELGNRMLFEITETPDGHTTHALRLGQPAYPHMKLVAEEAPDGSLLFRADAHDSHLHAAPGSADDAPLAQLRASNRALTDRIEAAWTAAGLKTFRQYLRQQLERRKAQA